MNDNYNAGREHKKTADSLAANTLRVIQLQDTLNKTRDSLFKIGLGIDERTGKILVLDSQILKTVLKLKKPGLPDSINFSIQRKGDTLSIAPKEGVWALCYVYLDANHFTDEDANHIILTEANDGFSSLPVIM